MLRFSPSLLHCLSRPRASSPSSSSKRLDAPDDGEERRGWNVNAKDATSSPVVTGTARVMADGAAPPAAPPAAPLPLPPPPAPRARPPSLASCWTPLKMNPSLIRRPPSDRTDRILDTRCSPDLVCVRTASGEEDGDTASVAAAMKRPAVAPSTSCEAVLSLELLSVPTSIQSASALAAAGATAAAPVAPLCSPAADFSRFINSSTSSSADDKETKSNPSSRASLLRPPGRSESAPTRTSGW